MFLGLVPVPALHSSATRQCYPLVRRAGLMSASRMGSVIAAGGRTSAAVTQDLQKDVAKSTPKPMLDLKPPRATRDFYPEDMALRTWLFNHWRDTAALHGFEEYDAPVLESEELFIRKAGEDVSQQLYNLEDRSGRRLSLRPEMTPSLARMVLAKRNGLALPLKWFSIPQCWRYERATRGRRREHYQWNLDVWGVDGLQVEAELLSAAITFMKAVGLTSAEVGVKISTRAVLAELLPRLGVPPERFASTCVLVDKLDKLPEDQIVEALTEAGMTAENSKTLLEALDIRSFDALQELMGADSPAVQELETLFDLAKAYGYEDWLVLDLSVVRGLAYYTGVVFEGFDRSGELRAIFGGGRYNKLLSTFGGDDLPAAGFGFGDAVIVELLKNHALLPSLSASPAQIVVFPMQEELRSTAVQVASSLRAAGSRVDLTLEPKKTKWLFKHADRLEASHVVIIGTSEFEQGNVRIKRLSDGEQQDVPIAELTKWALALNEAPKK